MAAVITLVVYRNSDRIPGQAVYLLILIGMLDFLSVFFFGFFSSIKEVQLFYHDATHNPTVFPIGLIPFFVVQYAICSHTLSLLNQKKYGTVEDPVYSPATNESGSDGSGKKQIDLVSNDHGVESKEDAIYERESF